MNRARRPQPRTKKIASKPEAPATPTFPMRVNKYLAWKGIATRREADTLIEKRKVTINGTIARLGDKVQEHDVVALTKAARPKAYVYLAFHKPAGMDTHREATSESNIVDALPADIARMGVFPIGRLDKASSGLIILTNDGRITDRLLNPAHAHQKVYDVTTKKPLRASFKEKMEAGVNIEGYQTKPTKVEVMGTSRFRITLTEGKSHQIRRMVVAVFNEVQTLKRLSIMNIKLGPLKKGGYRVIEGKELEKFLSDLGLGQSA